MQYSLKNGTYSYSASKPGYQTVHGSFTVLDEGKSIDVVLLQLFTVRFEDWDGRAISTLSVAFGEPAISPADPERAGYIFTGWDTDFTSVTSDLTVTAEYDPE